VVNVLQRATPERGGPHGRMRPQLTWVSLHNGADQRSNDAVHRFGTAAAGPIGESSVQTISLTIVQAPAPAENRARSDQQARGHLFNGVAFMEPYQRLCSVQLSRVMSRTGQLNQPLLCCV
jgi:hypothetical protein